MSGEDKASGRRSLVRCTVCGEIFDSSLDQCPVCFVGRDFFEPIEEEVVEFKKNTDEVFVILGNGIAGISAAEALRQRNETCSILMISQEEYLGYNRILLTKALSTLTDIEAIVLHNREWYRNNKITNILGSKVVEINPADKMIRLDDGQKIKYDKCIYALGAECFIPPIQGVDKPGVIAIRSFADVRRIHDMMAAVKNAVVIGGGVLGLEAAWELKKFAQVTVLEVADRLMGRQLDDEAGQFLEDIIREEGIGFRVGAKIVEITGDGSVTGVKLEDGTLYPADLVIVSCGVKSNTELAKAAGLMVERSVVVDEKLATSDKDIFACGDCAQYQNVNYALWSQGLEMGKVAGANAAGDTLTYEIVPAALTFHGMNTSLFAVGDNGKNPELSYQVQGARDDAKKTYEKYYYVDGKLVGSILIGDISKMPEVLRRMNPEK